MSYVLTWPSNRGPCCLEVPAATFHAIAACDPRAVRVGRALRFPGPVRSQSAPVFFESSSVDWVGWLCFVLAGACLVFGLHELSNLSGLPIESLVGPGISATKLIV